MELLLIILGVFIVVSSFIEDRRYSKRAKQLDRIEKKLDKLINDPFIAILIDQLDRVEQKISSAKAPKKRGRPAKKVTTKKK